ncbi:hypothetical protein G7B40_013035 [Aetokthonos hydrillicola Thurmond2011]|uniref:Uncharacterized protein n=1 Tax=Aetokthonos hydrillicola Thurmond2011 TaxID=2712845 RepID=A0AAP5IAH2_9CYAN|nr:hypothetical protein [Aetokthonos hydrillicola]MBO3459457.1 hypothetical protein [Aetokthonos hydrillicola CCALA 1050]MBW4583820.1 hypothetical protein [Aetokthonos hydrillicola CCALA 1050]MDR9895485.1 hypothetical protein [Aetokthonos hydrillicola Thurmond2011]
MSQEIYFLAQNLRSGLLIVPVQVSAENVGSTTNSTNPGNAFGAIAYSPSTQMYGSFD